MNIAGRANDPITVIIGDIDGLNAFMKPPIASRAPMIKQVIDAILMRGTPISLLTLSLYYGRERKAVRA